MLSFLLAVTIITTEGLQRSLDRVAGATSNLLCNKYFLHNAREATRSRIIVSYPTSVRGGGALIPYSCQPHGFCNGITKEETKSSLASIFFVPSGCNILLRKSTLAYGKYAHCIAELVFAACTGS